jgi:hypothetical protein
MAAKKKGPSDDALRELRAFGLSYPEAHTKSPWPGHMDLAVRDKTFAYLSVEGEPLGISCKLPQSSVSALMLPFTKPTEYGLGKSGWVSARFAPGDAPPIDLLKAWIDESYRAQAPKKLVALLDAGGGAQAAPAAGGGGRKAAARRPTVRRAAKRKAR